MKNSFQEKKCWGSENLFGEMKLFVGDTKQIVGGNEAKLWGNEIKFVEEMPQVENTFENSQRRKVKQMQPM